MKIKQNCTEAHTQCPSVLIVAPYRHFSLATAFFLETLKIHLKDSGEVRFLTRNYPRILTEVDISFIRDMLLLKPNVIGFSNFFWNLEQNIKLALLAKSLLPGTFVIFGGPQVGNTGNAADLLEKHHCIDAILCGEADYTFPELVRQIIANEEIGGLAGLVVRRGNDISIEQGQCYVQDVNSLPIVFHQGSEYSARYLNANDLIPMQTLRGCRQACSYCLYCTSTPRLFSLDRVEEEIGFLSRHRAKYVRVCDSHFGGSRKRAMELFSIIRHHNIETVFSIYPDPRHLDQEYIRAAGGANCRIISLGVETLDPAISSNVNRNPDDAEFMDALHLLSECGSVPQLDMMFGLPKQSEESFRKDLIHLKLEGARNILFSPLMVFPGTGLNSTMDENGVSTLSIPQQYAYDTSLGLDEYAAMIATSICYRLLGMFPRMDYYAVSSCTGNSQYKERLEELFSEVTSFDTADMLMLFDKLSASSGYLRANARSLADMAAEYFGRLINKEHDTPGFLTEIACMDIMVIAMKQRRNELARDIHPRPDSIRVISESDFMKLPLILSRDTWLETHTVPYQFATMGQDHSPAGSSDKVYCIYFSPTCSVHYVDRKDFEFLQRFTQPEPLFDSGMTYSPEYLQKARDWSRTGILGIDSRSPRSASESRPASNTEME